MLGLSPRYYFIVLATVLVCIAYYPVVNAGFIWDDETYVLGNKLLHNFDGLRRIWLTTETPQYYPLVFSTFWVEYQLYGLSPLGYHLVNVLLHLINAILVAAICRKLGFSKKLYLPEWIALLFLLHPVHVESVAWVTERKNVLSGAFYLAAFLNYLNFQETSKVRSYLVALVLFVLALLSKSVTCTLPAIFALVIFYRGADRSSR